MSAYKIQMPGNYPEESIQHSEHSESLKSRICRLALESTQSSIHLFNGCQQQLTPISSSWDVKLTIYLLVLK